MSIIHLRPDVVKGKYDYINKKGYHPEDYENQLDYAEGYAEALAMHDAKNYSQSTSIIQFFPKQIQDHYHTVYKKFSIAITHISEFL
jgi:hypothetical protein